MGGGVVMNDAFIASQLRAYTKSDLNARNKGLAPPPQCIASCAYRLDWTKYPASWKFNLQNVDSQNGTCSAGYFNGQWILKSLATDAQTLQYYPIFGEMGVPSPTLPDYKSCPWVGTKHIANSNNFIQAGLGYIPSSPANGNSDTDVWYLIIMNWKYDGVLAKPVPGCYIVYQAKGRDWQACGPNVMTLYEAGNSITNGPGQIKLTAVGKCDCTNPTCCPGRLYPQTLGYEIFNTSCESMKFSGTLRLFSPPCWNTGPGSEWYRPNIIGEGLLGYGGWQSSCPVYFAPVNPEFNCGGVAGDPTCPDALVGALQPFCCSGITLSCSPNGWRIFGQFQGCGNPEQLFTFIGDATNLAVYECNPIELEWPNCYVIQNFDCSASFWAPNGSSVSDGRCINGPSGGICPPIVGANVGLNQLYMPIGDWSLYTYGNNGTPTCSVTCNPGSFGYDQYFFDVGGFRDTDRCLASSLNRVFTYPRDFFGQFGTYQGCAGAGCNPGPLYAPEGCGGGGELLTTENYWIFTPLIGDPINGPCYGGLPRCQTIGIRIFEIS